MLEAGQTPEQVLSSILGSAEFFAHTQTLVASGTADERYLTALYQLLMGRTSRPSRCGRAGNAAPS
jgi:hypothetical protein